MKWAPMKTFVLRTSERTALTLAMAAARLALHMRYPAAYVALLASLCLNVLLLATPNALASLRRRLQEAGKETAGEPDEPTEPQTFTPLGSSALHDCASIACPTLFSTTSPISTGDTYRPRSANPRTLAPPMSMLQLTRSLYGGSANVGDVYRGYSNPYGKHPSGSYRWTQITNAMLKHVWSLLGGRVRFIVEVGSFAGGSAMVLGRFAAQQPGPVAPVLCIDTWLGDVNMALGRVERKTVDKRHGQPSVYHQFLVNIIHAQLTEHVLPMMASSFIGAQILGTLGLAADLIYLDSAHELRETFFELGLYWPLLSPGGILVGDDLNWQAVNRDVKLFARIHRLQLSSFDGCHRLKSFKNPSGSGYRTCVWYLLKQKDAQPANATQPRSLLASTPLAKPVHSAVTHAHHASRHHGHHPTQAEQKSKKHHRPGLRLG